MVHLHNRSCYSLLESPFRIEQMIQAAKENHHTHLALTDHHSMYATMKFFHLCRQNNIHPIFGLELEVNENDYNFSFVLLAKDDMGLIELYKISSQLMSFQTFDSVKTLAQQSQHCVCMTGGTDDSLYQWVIKKDADSIQRCVKTFSDLWQDFYVAISMNDSGYHRENNAYLKLQVHNASVATVALSRNYYWHQEDAILSKVLRAIDKGSTIKDDTLDFKYDRYYRNDQQMAALYDPDDLEQTETIARMCNVQLAYPKSQLPTFDNQQGMDNQQYLINLCKAGLKKRLNNQIEQEYVKRLEYECNVITSMGFTDYFLIVYDFIRYARKENIYVGPGRGSSAGSLVAYCLGITHVDPIKNGLIFERFLNPDRISMPDIDVDFPDDKRDQVIEYLNNKYGNKKVAHIVTFSTLKAKQVFNDVGRVMSINDRLIKRCTTAVDQNQHETLLDIYNDRQSPLRAIIEQNRLNEYFQLCLRLEGLPRTSSVHAAGIVISDREIENVCPTLKTDSDVICTQFTMEYLEQLGLIKMDLLVLRNLKTIADVVEAIHDSIGIDIQPLKLPLNDQKTFSLISRGDTLGIFQFERKEMRKFLVDMKVQRFQDICIAMALFRPGPIKNIPVYLERKQNPQSIRYIHPLLEPILKETYGVIVYQEQIMRIATDIGGLSLSQADTLRKAMSKKNAEMMASFKDQFIEGAIRNKVSSQVAQEIYSLMERFADYGFNKAHSYVYGMITYQLAYLKANYPLFFYQSLLNANIRNENKTSDYIYECKRRHIDVKSPDINKSELTYSIEDKSLRMPFSSMKGIGQQVSQKILEERENGKFVDYIDFIKRAYLAKINDSSIRVLIQGGALDCFGLNRATMLDQLNDLSKYVEMCWKKVGDQWVFDQGLVGAPILMPIKENVFEKSQREKEIFGFYLTEHPVQSKRHEFTRSIPLKQCEEMNGYFQVLGLVNSYRVIDISTGKACFMRIEDESGIMEVAIWPDLYAIEKENIGQSKLCLIDGQKKPNRKDQITARKIKWL